MQANAISIRDGAYATSNGLQLGKLNLSPGSLHYLDDDYRSILLQTLTNSRQYEGDATYKYRGESTPDDFSDGTFFVSQTAKKHARLETHYKAFHVWNPKVDVTTASLATFRDRLAVYHTNYDVLHCVNEPSHLILLENVVSVKATTNGGQSREFKLLFGRKAVRFEENTEHAYPEQ